jgi:hypothetical protein
MVQAGIGGTWRGLARWNRRYRNHRCGICAPKAERALSRECQLGGVRGVVICQSIHLICEGSPTPRHAAHDRLRLRHNLDFGQSDTFCGLPPAFVRVSHSRLSRISTQTQAVRIVPTSCLFHQVQRGPTLDGLGVRRDVALTGCSRYEPDSRTSTRPDQNENGRSLRPTGLGKSPNIRANLYLSDEEPPLSKKSFITSLHR